MATINTKFGIGDFVFTLQNNQIKRAVVKDIFIIQRSDNYSNNLKTRIEYQLSIYEEGVRTNELSIFTTKEELLSDISSEYEKGNK